MRYLVPLIVLIATSSPAVAQEIRVRAGDQATFSRIVVPIGQDETWELRSSGRRTVFELPSGSGSFNLDEISARIPRTRVLSARNVADGAGFEIALGCDCVVSADVSGNSVVIDIADPGMALPDVSDTPVIPGVQPEMAAAPQRTEPAADIRDGAERDDGAAPEAVARPEAATGRVAATEPARDTANSAIVETLIRQIENAAEQGIVALPDVPSRMSPDPVLSDVPAPAPALPPDERGVDGLEELSEQVMLGISKETRGAEDSVRISVPEAKEVPDTQVEPTPMPQIPVAENGRSCIPPEQLDVASWVIGDDVAAQITGLRNQLYDDLDRIDPVVLRDLVRLYVALGFGVEARALLSDADALFDGKELLAEMASLADGDDPPRDGILAKAISCRGAAALWRTVGFDQETQPVDHVDEVLDEFAALPVEVRRLYAPRLVRSLMARGQIDAAKAAFAIVDRAVGPHGDAHELIRATLLAADNETFAAERILLDLYLENGPLAPEALMRVADLYEETGRPVPASMIEDLAAEAYRYRGDPMGRQLRLAEIKARAGGDKLDEALGVISEVVSRDSEADPSYFAAADQILSEAKWDDIGAASYSGAVFRHEDLVASPEISAETQLHVANEILDIGLPAPALRLAARPIAVKVDGARHFMAKAFISLDDPEAALRQLDPNDRNDATLRATALQLLGRFDTAYEVATTFGMPVDGEAAWLAGDWQRATDSEDPSIADLSKFMVRTAGTNDPALRYAFPAISEETGSQDAAAREAVTLRLAQEAAQDAQTSRNVIASAMEKY